MKKTRIWALSTCVHCRRARQLLDELGTEYEVHEVDTLAGSAREAALAEMVRHNPERSFPTILIGDEVIVGFRPERIREALVDGGESR